jgi:hypothetical protein
MASTSTELLVSVARLDSMNDGRKGREKGRRERERETV